MTRTSSWWRRLGTALAALVMTAIVFGPSLDSLICRDDSGLGAVAAEVSVVATVDHGQPGDTDKGVGACLHGHCHHGGVSAVLPPRAVPRPLEVRLAEHVVLRDRIGRADRKFDLMRPPRA